MVSTTRGGAIGDQYPIYIGPWVNWSHGQLMGATLTLKQADANLLIAFIAFFIAFVATRFWRILCFALHQFYSTPKPQESLYHQRQAILRNSSSPEESLKLLCQLLWSYQSSRRPRSTFALFAAVLCIASFTTAGIFSSSILMSTPAGNEVLIDSKHCGYTLSPARTQPGFWYSDMFLAERVNNAANHAQRCYSNNSDNDLGCGGFATNRLPSTVNVTASCPFSNEMCRNISTNIRFDTGYIDSHDDFGLNTPPDKRIKWRSILHCAPLVTKGFTSQRNVSSLGSVTFYHYGRLAGLGNYTYAAQSVASQYSITRSSDITMHSTQYQLE